MNDACHADPPCGDEVNKETDEEEEDGEMFMRSNSLSPVLSEVDVHEDGEIEGGEEEREKEKELLSCSLGPWISEMVYPAICRAPRAHMGRDKFKESLSLAS